MAHIDLGLLESSTGDSALIYGKAATIKRRMETMKQEVTARRRVGCRNAEWNLGEPASVILARKNKASLAGAGKNF